MHVTPQQRTILEYAMTISGDDANLCLMDPLAFGKKVRTELLAHMPGAALVEDAKPEHRPARKAAHKRAGRKGAAGKAAGAGSGETPAPHSRKPRTPTGQTYPCPAPRCVGTFKTHGWLAAHMAKNHPDLPIPEKK